MSATTLAQPEIAQFASAVRAALADLTPDEIDDLTDGLEADLTERLADGDAVELGDPVAYAEELRTAAGLPRRAKPATSVMAELRSVPRATGRQLRAFAGRYPAVNGLWQFVVSLRPVWWVFRAGVVTWLVMSVFGRGVTSTIALAVVLAVVSVQFGRGKWLPFAWMKSLLLLANIVLAIATPFVAAAMLSTAATAYVSQMYPQDSYIASGLGTGLVENGSQVSNIFAYDAQGNPLTDVQLFDQDGKPLDLVGDPTMTFYNADGSDVFLVPNESVTGRLGWNVFPLTHVSQSDLTDNGTVKSRAIPLPAVAPFGTAKPLAGAGTTPSAAATPSPSPIPTP